MTTPHKASPAEAGPAVAASGGIRVLHAMAGAAQGGAELYFERLCLALQRAGLSQLAVIRPHPERVAKLEAGGVAVTGAKYGGLLDFTTRRAIKSAIASFRPQIVLSYMTRATRFIVRGNFVHIARLGGYYNLRHYRHCDHLVGNTPDLIEYFLRHNWPHARVHFIPNFVDTRKCAPADRARFNTPASVPLVLALGRFHPNKAFDVLLAAMSRLPEAYLWLAGDGPERPALEALSAELGLSGRVRFLGWQDDPAPLFAAADALAVPSRHEPLGNVVLEGWAQDRAVVAAASHGPRFLIRDGENGLLVPVEDVGSLSAALARVLGDRGLAARLVEGGRTALAAEFSEQAVVGRYLALFQQVLA
ncbi:MAG TPA: glycosyltransferase [Alphaproteobacteria bacterium]|nr:glycosyltransferase [Alphaproteobacteria bacterium]